jgi:hypothetical protein
MDCRVWRGWETPTLLGPLERANLNHCRVDAPHPVARGRKQIRFPKRSVLLCSSEYRAMDKALSMIYINRIHHANTWHKKLCKRFC